jgi:hypothetical protein
MKSILTIIFLLSFLHSQTTIDVVQLKNGDIIKGIITENVFNDYIRIELAGGSILTFQYSEILNITKETVNNIIPNESNDRMIGREIKQIDSPNPQTSLWFKGPILGYTYIPNANNFAIGIDYLNGNTTSLFNADKKEEHFSDIFYEDDAASPVESFTMIRVSILYSINNNISIRSSIPIIIDQSWEWNPASKYEDWFEENQPDEFGESGLGDISVRLSYLLDLKDYRMNFSSYYKFATGSSPDEKPSNSWQSTGSGQTDLGFGLNGDFKLSSSLFVSGFGYYEIRNESTYNYDGEKFKRKWGNNQSFGSRLTLEVVPNFAIAIQLSTTSSEDYSIDGEQIKDSAYDYIKFIPSIGYQLKTSEKTVNIQFKYSNKISGENTWRYKYFFISSSILF